MNELHALLASAYGIVANSIQRVPGGFSAKAAYRVDGADGIAFFLKVYDNSLPTTRMFVERINNYMPVLEALAASPALRGQVLTPVPSRQGAYKVETAGDVYVLFLYVQGETPGIQGMTRAQTIDLARILARLHEFEDTVLEEVSGLDEDISLPFCKQLTRFLDHTDMADKTLYAQVAPHTGLLRKAINEALHLRDTVRQGHTPLVLCHGDAHGNNVIQGERLVLADWEDLRRAPAEADLFIYAWHPYGRTLLEAYAEARRGFRMNCDLLRFYVLRRRLEDVWVDIQRLTEESPDEAEAITLLDWVRRGIEEIQVLYRTDTEQAVSI